MKRSQCTGARAASSRQARLSIVRLNAIDRRLRWTIRCGCVWLALALWGGPEAARARAGAFDWAAVPEIHPGIQHAFVAVTDPRPMKINVLRVNLENARLRFHATGRHPDWGQAMAAYPELTIRTGRQRTRDYLIARRAEGLNMVAAVNASGWRPWNELSRWRKEIQPYPYADQLGLTISDGVLVCESPGRPSLIFDRDGRPSLRLAPPNASRADIRVAVSGQIFVLRNGKAEGRNTRAEPRTGYGLSADGRQVFLMTIDGRRTGYSEGATHREVGEWLRHFGAWEGLNMDGGGSTTLVLLSPDQSRARIVNRPSGLWGARAVGSNLGVYYEHPPQTVP
ncbi:MAG: phosphodiester glycosidase family protein [Candidatus Marinimicrobia bacterium]|nr:phosphodiester glycosidase family protein [Candidatus Neomarinimicrobiota bacterium]